MSLDLRSDFPLLERRVDDQPIIYLDSAATSLKPQAVLDAERRYSTEFTANIHRGKHFLSEEASFAYESARKRIAQFIHADPRGVVLAANTTQAINMVASGLRVRDTDTVLCLSDGHHSNLVPWMQWRNSVVVDRDPLAPIELTDLELAVHKHKPKVFAFTHASNVTGALHPARELCHWARDRGLISVVDAAQSAPHVRIDVADMGCDFLAFSAHKMLGPTGVGVLYGRPEILDRLQPTVYGGGMVDRVTRQGCTLKDIPYRLEPGTPNISGVLGTAAAVDYLEGIGWGAIAAHEEELRRELQVGLCGLPSSKLLMANVGLALASVAATTEKADPDVLAVALSETYRITVRSGFHCAHVLFDELGLARGALRASAYIYNTPEEVRQFCKALSLLMQRLG